MAFVKQFLAELESVFKEYGVQHFEGVYQKYWWHIFCTNLEHPKESSEEPVTGRK